MFRIKVIASLVLILSAAAGFLYLKFEGEAQANARTVLEQRLRVAGQNVVRNRQLSVTATVAKAEQVSAWPQMAQILTRPAESFANEAGEPPNAEEYSYQIHRLMNAEVKVWRAKFKALAADPSKANGTLADWRVENPDLFMVVNAQGIGVAKATDPAWFGPKEANIIGKFPLLKQSLDGASIKDIWMVESSPMTVAVVPIRKGERVVGATILGYRLTDSEARRDKDLVATEVAYFVGPRMTKSSSLSSSLEQSLQKVVVGEKLYQGKSAGILEFDLQGTKYLGVVGMMKGYIGAKNAGYVVLADLTGAIKVATASTMIIVLVILGAMLLLILLLIVFYQQHQSPYEEIDQGVMEIINGNLDYWFDIPGKELPGTMSQNLNIMVCQLSGRPLPDEGGGGAWMADSMFVGGVETNKILNRDSILAGDTIGIPQPVVELLCEDESAYLRRTFREYTQGLTATGASTQGITFEVFTEKLSNNATALSVKFECDKVRFLVMRNGDKVKLQPVPFN